MFFKRLSRSRGNSYVDDYDSPRDEKPSDAPVTVDNIRPSSSRQSAPNYNDVKDHAMFPRQQQPQEVHYSSAPRAHVIAPMDSPSHLNKTEPMPDLLTRAFNEAVRPYTEKIDQMEYQIADLQALVDELRQQQAEIHSWIDKRGLRPGMRLQPFDDPKAH